jgi:hypothetical protein
METDSLKRLAPEDQKLHDAWVENERKNNAFNQSSLWLLAVVEAGDVQFPHAALHKVHAVD